METDKATFSVLERVYHLLHIMIHRYSSEEKENYAK